MAVQLNRFFNVCDYALLNDNTPNILTGSENEGIQRHRAYLSYQDSLTRGEYRLYNIKQINLNCEFGVEVILRVPYIAYLVKNGLFPANIPISTFAGSECLYYPILPKHLIQVHTHARRKWYETELRALPSGCDDEHNKLLNMNTQHRILPNYLAYYGPPQNSKDLVLQSILNSVLPHPMNNDKLIVVANKLTAEWQDNDTIYNHIDSSTLQSIFDMLAARGYIVIYTRSDSFDEQTMKQRGISYDDATHYNHREDVDIARNHPSGRVLHMESEEFVNSIQGSVLTLHGYDITQPHTYNLMRMVVFARCVDYVTVQGGGAHFLTYFAQRMVILHNHGPEKDKGVYEGWYLTNNDIPDKKVVVCETNARVLENVAIVYTGDV